ncbi:GNAT family N-acetyltransferase [Carboxylicivirga linearis]|uniref:GNAT family N-acetyltransferase n=1 Tax=Carboxylicivirga linearis TaxID=1628157 RepID=A0ABS5JYU8_9BACT|nr:GNAT family N-acetyltransferase [Carboxylicivirga linearis]MBS2100033.1 GNAT family N-acetyltransferase [Carboxylicivirga linearis]
MNEIYLNLPLIEWIGYLASTLVFISLSLSSLVKLRIYNFIGSSIFSFYGFYIGALPVGIMNLLIALFNIYYLRFLLFKKERFSLVRANVDDEFLRHYLLYHFKDICRFFPDFNLNFDKRNGQVLLALRDAKVAGVFIVSNNEEGRSEIILDYVTPEYRDYKTGRFLLQKYREQFADVNNNRLVCESNNKTHIRYLKKMGFEQVGEQEYILQM